MKPSKSRPHIIFLTLSDHELERVTKLAEAQAKKTASSWYKDYSQAALVRAALYLGFYSWAALGQNDDINLEEERQREIDNPLSYGQFRHRFGSAKLTEVTAD